MEALALYAGQSVGLSSRIQSAGEIVKQIANDAAETIMAGTQLLQGVKATI